MTGKNSSRRLGHLTKFARYSVTNLIALYKIADQGEAAQPPFKTNLLSNELVKKQL
jgi:hypothetical protein